MKIIKFQGAKSDAVQNNAETICEWENVSIFKYIYLRLFGYKTRTIKICLKHNFEKPIISRYISFNQRDIIHECDCGKRVVKRIYRPFHIDFPIETTPFIEKREFEKYLNKKSHE